MGACLFTGDNKGNGEKQKTDSLLTLFSPVEIRSSSGREIFQRLFQLGLGIGKGVTLHQFFEL